MNTGTEPIPADLLAALHNEYGAEWNVRHPGRYVADHRRLDVTIISDSVPELAGKLRAFTKLIKDLPLPLPPRSLTDTLQTAPGPLITWLAWVRSPA